MKKIRCKDYKNCDYRDVCSHAKDHYINTSNNPVANNYIIIPAESISCYCNEIFSEISHRKEKLEKIKKATE